MYVDDVLTGANSIDETISLRKDISYILQSAGMTLRKWCANNPILLHDVPDVDREQSVHIDENQYVKTLGLYWQANLDTFRLNVPSFDSTTVTKRKVISDIAKIFDPIGLVAPIVVWGKLFLQKLWQLKIDWDASLPMALHTYWIQFRNDLLNLNQLSVPRHLFDGCKNPSTIELHGFSDASERAYGVAVYVRYKTEESCFSRLLCSKSRIAPIKQTTMPRLELCAAQLLASLVKKLQWILNFTIKDNFYWTDSMIVLHWINSPSTRWKTFVANRISDIQSNSDQNKWRHVESKLNPADLVSRGTSTDNLLASEFWWNGPSFLESSNNFWIHRSEICCKKEDIPEQLG